jgi:hypothetical protein
MVSISSGDFGPKSLIMFLFLFHTSVPLLELSGGVENSQVIKTQGKKKKTLKVQLQGTHTML